MHSPRSFNQLNNKLCNNNQTSSFSYLAPPVNVQPEIDHLNVEREEGNIVVIQIIQSQKT